MYPENKLIYIESAPAKAPVSGDVIFPGEAGREGRDVYATLVLGANAYGTTEIKGGGLEHIVKQLGSSGTADPLNQRATAGWKGTKTAERLVVELKKWVDAEYADGRVTVMTDDEIIAKINEICLKTRITLG